MQEAQAAYSGKALRDKRQARLLTQDELAKALGVGKSTVVSWETGQKVPSLRNLRRLKQFFEQENNNESEK